jgi:fumarate hydratase class II
MVERGLALATALVPRIGYDAAVRVAKEAARTGKTVREVARENTDLTEEELERVLDPLAMTGPAD